MIQPLKIHQKFTDGLNQYLAMIDDLNDPRAQLAIRGASIEREYQAGPGISLSPPEAIKVKCANLPLAYLFESVLNTLLPDIKKKLLRHFDGPHAMYTRDWQSAVIDDAKHWGMIPKEYALELQCTINYVTSRL